MSVTQPCDGRHARDTRPFRTPGSRVVDMVYATRGGRHTTPQMVPPQLMSRTPNYVEVCLQQKVVLALVDSGSDFSLVSETVLNARQHRCIVQCHVMVLSASNELLPIVGQVFLDVEIGADSIQKKSHRFLVVSELIFGVILGMDFWVRVGGFTLDLILMKLDTISPVTSVPLLSLSSAAFQPNSSNESNDRQPIRCSTRSRQPPEKLQVDPGRSTYEYEREEY